VAAPAPTGPAAVPVAYLPSLTLPGLRLNPGVHRLTVSNYTYDTARLQVLVTPYPDCIVRAGAATDEFVLPLNGTTVLNAPAGADICWRREVLPTPGAAAPANIPGWSPWNRVYLTSGHAIDVRL
jgi:hypothetical protein